MRPLTPQTAALLKPLKLSSADTLSLSLDDSGDHYVASMSQPYGQPPSYAAQDHFPKRVPERKRLEGAGPYAWQFAATDVTSAIISAVWPRDQVAFRDEGARTTLQYHEAAGAALEANALRVAELKEWMAIKREHGDQLAVVSSAHARSRVPQGDYALHPERPLAVYQRAALHNAIGTPGGYALFMEQGTGKTPVVIAVTDNAPRNGKTYKALIVAPKNVRLNWQTEFDNFGTTQGKVTVLRGTDLSRVKLLIDAFTPSPGDAFTVVICSYEVMCRDWDRCLSAIEWDLAVLDEGHYIKSPGTARAKTAMKLRDKAKKRLILTGTPITNHPLDLYSQLEFLERGASGFMDWKAFKDFYGVWRPTESGHKALVGLQNLPFLKERLAHRTFMVTKEEALPGLPPKVFDVVECEMGDEQRDVYDQVSRQLAAEIERDLASGGNKQLVVQNMLVRLLRLAQITSGFVVWDETWDQDVMTSPREVDRFDPNPKMDTVVETVKEHLAADRTSKALLWACWVQDIKTLAARLRLEGIEGVTFWGQTGDDERAEAERRFNHDPSCRWFLGNPGAGGTGLNLIGYPPHDPGAQDTACDFVGYYSQDWSAVKRSQSGDRAHRRGTRRPVRVVDFVVPGTIDEEIRRRVTKKQIMALTVSDIREILKNATGGGAGDE